MTVAIRRSAGTGQMRSEDRAARGHFYGGDAPAEEDDKAVTVVDAEHAGGLGQRRDDVLGDLVRAGRAGFLVADVQVIATDEPHAQHNLRHGPHLSCPAGNNEGRGPGARYSRRDQAPPDLSRSAKRLKRRRYWPRNRRCDFSIWTKPGSAAS